ncbi:hypothetical protein AM493_15480 [Flavobacterium akiainvivens]|uniref:DUF3828 domain-containing protein n=1 Tax=Flavobacterium akiainvivens TaxID=1202724 RepID=A0A0M9VJB0_9FLAO|nr:hypothetical protein [Flavobacterium akiainvivens]KOS07282.1 hypothetical protein AM493_15480 [Flavobacterium akiainvivens]SFQ46156.1 hypothetical protein SAMN05444144_10578 [Flavobacterium akiainvivens]
MKYFLVLVSALTLFTSCKNDTGVTEVKPEGIETAVSANSQPDAKVALTFINDYLDNINKMNEATGLTEWLSARTDATKGFKTEVKRIIDEAYKADPELGLGFDPLIDGQDAPERMELKSVDKNGYILLKGKDWADFELVMKLKQENGKWLVDGCGIVNIPESKRAPRE